MPTVTSNRYNNESRNGLKFIVHTENDAPRDASTEWFTQHSIGSLQFKCKAWNKVARAHVAVSETELVPVIAEKFNISPTQFEIKFSRTAGCSCGCSPGYVGKLKSYHAGLSHHVVWVKDIPLTEANKAALVQVCAKQAAALEAEKLLHTTKS